MSAPVEPHSSPLRRSLRVAIIAPFGLRPKGTSIARVLPIARVLAAQGATVRLLIPPWDDPTNAGKRWTDRGVEIAHTRLGHGPMRVPVILRDMLSELRSFEPDVVHAFKPIGYSGVLAQRLAARKAGGPLVVVDADDLEGRKGWAGRRGMAIGGWLRDVQESATLRAAHRITVASRRLEAFVRGLGVPAEHILRIPNGHDEGDRGQRTEHRGLRTAQSASRPADPRPPTPDPQLVWYTRYTEASPGRATALLAPILRSRPSLRLAVLGDELEAGGQAALAGAFAALGVAGQIDWVAYDPQRAKSYLAARSETAVAVYPLDDDLVNRARCPSKIPQLMALGVPLVAEAVGEAPAYLEGFTRCLTAPGDATGFRQRVGDLLDAPALRAELSARLQAGSGRWQWGCTAHALLPWYESALAGGEVGDGKTR